MEEILLIAENNRYKCSCCSGKICKEEKFFRSSFQAWRASHTVNICERCMVRFVMGMSENRIGKIKKEIILEGLEVRK